MNPRTLALAVLVLAGGVLSGSQASSDGREIVRANGPTIVAFYAFDQAHPARAGAKAETDEALADFQFYAEKVKEPLRKRGIQFQEVYALSFQIQIGEQRSMVKGKQFKYGVGYYLIAPGKQPQFEDGVMTDEDLLEVADRYFAASAK